MLRTQSGEPFTPGSKLVPFDDLSGEQSESGADEADDYILNHSG
jgi:hypothetical protein